MEGFFCPLAVAGWNSDKMVGAVAEILTTERAIRWEKPSTQHHEIASAFIHAAPNCYLKGKVTFSFCKATAIVAVVIVTQQVSSLTKNISISLEKQQI